MLVMLGLLVATLIAPPPASSSRLLLERRSQLLERERAAVARSERVIHDLALRELEAPPTLGYLSKTAGCYQRDGLDGPPPSAVTLARNNFIRELKELAAAVIGRPLSGEVSSRSEAGVYSPLQNLELSNDKIWKREAMRPPVPAPLLIKLPYYGLCGLLDSLFDGRPIARFWFLETVARIPYFAYNSMITLYEIIGWWRRSAALKKTHFGEDWNEFHHLLIMEALGGDQAWSDRFVAQHAALLYYFSCLLLWVLSPTLAYNFSELIEAHAVDTYAEFIDANEALLRDLPPPAIAIAFYDDHAESSSAPVGSPMIPVMPAGKVTSLYDVFCNIRNDEQRHVDSMISCQDGDVRKRARIVELGAILAGGLFFAEVFFAAGGTVETVETVENWSVPLVEQVEKRVERQVARGVDGVESRFEEALLEAEVGGNHWNGYSDAP